jgi:hypothetical protein
MGRLLAVTAFGVGVALGASATVSADETSPEPDVVESPGASTDDSKWD